jgi:3-oxoacyl-[acyl-carrier-protein] synthase II
MKNRVVVTGMGCISPLGNSVSETWEGISAGRSGIDRITKFDAKEFRSQMAGEVKNFDPSPVIEDSELKKMDIFIQYALVAAAQALQDANLEITEELSWDVGASI